MRSGTVTTTNPRRAVGIGCAAPDLGHDAKELAMIPQDFPPVVYVPCTTVPDTETVNVTLRRTADGRTALLVYSALDRLRAGAGDDVPWSLMIIPELQRVHDETPYDVLYLDLRIPERARGQVTA